MASLTRTVEIEDITPDELAAVFCEFFAEEQARFFKAIAEEARNWPNSGWCGQACAIAKNIQPEALEVVKAIVDHVELAKAAAA
jgi:hypothetical protein